MNIPHEYRESGMTFDSAAEQTTHMHGMLGMQWDDVDRMYLLLRLRGCVTLHVQSCLQLTGISAFAHVRPMMQASGTVGRWA